MQIRIGHPSYGAWCQNHAVMCSTKQSAVRELCKRFVPRSRARKAVSEAIRNGYGASTHTETPTGCEYGIELAIFE